MVHQSLIVIHFYCRHIQPNRRKDLNPISPGQTPAISSRDPIYDSCGRPYDPSIQYTDNGDKLYQTYGPHGIRHEYAQIWERPNTEQPVTLQFVPES